MRVLVIGKYSILNYKKAKNFFTSIGLHPVLEKLIKRFYDSHANLARKTTIKLRLEMRLRDLSHEKIHSGFVLSFENYLS